MQKMAENFSPREIRTVTNFRRQGHDTQLADARGFKAEMKYDAFDRQSRWVFPSKTTAGVADQNDYEEYGYDAAGNRTSLRKRDGSVLTYQYDAANRVSSKIVPERAGLTAAQTRDVYYAYDNRGFQIAVWFDGNDLERVWHDGFGRPATALSRMAGQDRYLNHIHDRDGNREHLIFTNDGGRLRFYYDGLGRMAAAHDRANPVSGDDAVVRYWHRPEGPKHVGVFGAGAAGFTSIYYYDPVQRLALIANDLSPRRSNWGIYLAYNPAGQIVRRELTDVAYAWTGARSASRDYRVNGLNPFGPRAISRGMSGIERRAFSESAGLRVHPVRRHDVAGCARPW
jgi:YD repeat-containing protein